MKISCQACGAKYTIADDKVRGKTVKIKCKKCGASIVVSGESGDDAGEWSVIVAEGDTRTLSPEQIASLIRSGEITSGTYAWREGMADWLPIDSIAELAAVVDDPVAAAPAAGAVRAPSPTMNLDDDDDDDMPTRAGVIPEQIRALGRSPSVAPAPAARAPAPLPAAGRGPDLFANPGGDSGASMFGGGGSASPSVSPAANRGSVRPAAPVRPSSSMASDEASGLVDMRALQSALASTKAKPKETKKDESSFDDIMNLGAPPAFEVPAFGAPTINFDAPTIDPMAPSPPPQVEAPVSMVPGAVAAPAGYAPVAEKKKSSTGLIIGGIIGAVALLGIGGGGVALMMSSKGNEVAKADPASTSTAVNTANGAGTAATATPTATTSAAVAATDTAAKPGDPAPADTAPSDPATATKDPKDAKDPKDSKAADKDKKEKERKEKEEKEKKEKEEKEKKEKADADAAAAAAAAAASEAPFDRSAAMSALSAGAGAAAGCKTADGPTGSGKVSVTFAPSGRVTQSTVQGAPFAGTSVGSCVAAAFRGAKVPPFGGGPVTVSKGFSIN